MNNVLLRLAGWSLQRALVASLILGAIFFFTVFDDGAAQDQQLAQINSEITTEEAKQVESERALQEVEQVRATVEALSDQFKTASQRLPADVQMADILRVVDSMSKTTGVSIKFKEPKEPITKDIIEEIPLKLELEGNYSEITNFLFYVSTLERIMKVTAFTISNAAAGYGEGAPGPTPPGTRLKFDGSVVSYRFVGVKQEPPPPEGKAP